MHKLINYSPLVLCAVLLVCIGSLVAAPQQKRKPYATAAGVLKGAARWIDTQRHGEDYSMDTLRVLVGHLNQATSPGEDTPYGEHPRTVEDLAKRIAAHAAMLADQHRRSYESKQRGGHKR